MHLKSALPDSIRPFHTTDMVTRQRKKQLVYSNYSSSPSPQSHYTKLMELILEGTSRENKSIILVSHFFLRFSLATILHRSVVKFAEENVKLQ